MMWRLRDYLEIDWHRLLTFTLVLAVALAFASWLTPTGRIYRAVNAGQTAALNTPNASQRATSLALVDLRPKIYQFQKTWAKIDGEMGFLHLGNEQSQADTLALAQELEEIKPAIDKLDRSVPGVKALRADCASLWKSTGAQ